MYFAMDDIGFENLEKIQPLDSESDRWKFIYDIAKAYGFDGIHITPSFYDRIKLDLNNIPDYLNDFKLTLHFGGLYRFISSIDINTFDKELEARFEIALKHNMHDISIHPPYTHEMPLPQKELCLDSLHNSIDKWLRVFSKSNISLSLESHCSGKYFLFDGLREYASFAAMHPELGVLIDISHNYYDRYSEEDIINILGHANIKGLHISDAIQGAEFKEGTHLAVGDGTMDFTKFINHFSGTPNLFAVLEIKAGNEGISKSLSSLKQLLAESRSSS